MFKSACFILSLIWTVGQFRKPGVCPAHCGIFQSPFLRGRENVLDPCFPTSRENTPTLTASKQAIDLISLFKKKKTGTPVLGNHVKTTKIGWLFLLVVLVFYRHCLRCPECILSARIISVPDILSPSDFQWLLESVQGLLPAPSLWLFFLRSSC